MKYDFQTHDDENGTNLHGSQNELKGGGGGGGLVMFSS